MKNSLSLLLILIGSTLQAQDFALEQLNNSPRHHEWVEVTYNGRTVHSFVAYPEKSDKTQAVIVIHENRGLTDWVRSFADQMAAAGYLAIAPDLLSGFSENAEKTSDFESSDEARSAIYQLDPKQVTKDLNAVFNYISKVPSSTGIVSVMGFCWGGSQTFRYATNNANIHAALVFYGTAPKDAEAINRIEVPVYGFYGGNDQRVNSTIESTDKMMNEAGNTYQYEIYDGAGHAYMRRGDDPEGDAANKEARNKSWERIKKILDK